LEELKAYRTEIDAGVEIGLDEDHNMRCEDDVLSIVAAARASATYGKKGLIQLQAKYFAQTAYTLTLT